MIGGPRWAGGQVAIEPINARPPRPERLRFGPKHISEMENPWTFEKQVQYPTRVHELIVPRFGFFFEIETFRVGRVQVIGYPNTVSAGILREGSVLAKCSETAMPGQMISLTAQRAKISCRLAMTLREGAEVPKRWRDVEPAALQRLHPKCPRSSGEVEVAYDFSWPIPSWVIARVADLDKKIGESLEEPEVDQALIENVVFDAYAVGVSIDG